MKDIYLKDWSYAGNKVRFVYEDGSEIFVSKTDFDRAFGCLISAPKSVILKDYAVG